MANDASAGVFDQILNYNKNDSGEDFYAILGCDETSSEEQIVTEYKSRVLSCHPDKHPNDQGAHERFSLLSKAKDILLDPEKKKDYDRWRRSQVSVPYETWKSMGHVKTSMHWGVKPSQPALDHPGVSKVSGLQKSTPHLQTEGDKRIAELSHQMRFQHREPSSSGWKRDTSNPVLQKFRNYEI